MDVYQTLLVEVEAEILTITLNRPEYLNVLNLQLRDELEAVLSQAATDSAVRAILITGTGKAFSSGVDVHELINLNAQSGIEFALKGQRIFGLLEAMRKPSLVAVNGYAIGGGCELAIAATLRIAAENASFAQPEVKLGLIPGYGGTQRLARLIGKGRALDLCITGRSINAETALEYGLVSEVVVNESLLPRAREILQGILTMAPLAVQSVMEIVQTGYDLPLEDALALEASRFGLLCGTRDKNEGIAAFLAKRPACFNAERR